MARSIVRVLVVHPLATERARLEHLLAADPLLQVAGSADSAHAAVELATRRQPQVILLGPLEPLAQAVAWVQHVMQFRPTPLVALAGASGDQRPLAFALMEAGAIAVVPEPASGSDGSQERRALAQTLRLMAEVKVVRRWANPAPGQPRLPMPTAPAVAPVRRRRIDLVAIGASTGGPVALKQVLCALPAVFPVPVLVVQHMAHGFTEGLAHWLASSSSIRIEVARAGVVPQPGCAYLAPDDVHLQLGPDGALEFDAGEPEHGHRPAVSRLFASVASRCGPRAIGILLTGMGKDGAAEMKSLKDAGGITIAQDQPSSVVHGMPGEAIRCGGATHVMSPDEIAAALPALVGS